MALTAAQLSTLKADLLANTATIPAGKPWTNAYAGVQVKDVPAGGDGDATVAGWYSQTASPDFYVFRTNIQTAELFDQISWANYTPQDAITVLNQTLWAAWSLACQGKQFNLQIMLPNAGTFNAAPPGKRSGLNDATTNLPSGVDGATKTGGWSAILPLLRRTARYIEKILAAATTGPGTSADALGATTNPALMGYEGAITGTDVEQARVAA